jgi:hypothetical protein
MEYTIASVQKDLASLCTESEAIFEQKNQKEKAINQLLSQKYYGFSILLL